MQSIQLSIPTPCHENWDKMTPTEQGRFCNACARQVVDFTMMSDGEVLNYFLNKKDENVCGRTFSDQLNRVVEGPKPIKQNKSWYWKYAAAGLLFMTKDTHAQQNQISTTNANIEYPGYAERKQGEIAISTIKTITGQVRSEDGNALPFATIAVKGTNNKTSADANGFYQLRVNVETDELKISAIGHQVLEIKLKGLTSYNFTCKLAPKSGLIEVVVVGYMSSEYTGYSTNHEPKHIALIRIKDASTNNIIDNVKLVIKKNNQDIGDSVNLKKGEHKIKRISNSDHFSIETLKEGYYSKTILLSAENFNKRKGVFDIVLEKKETVQDGISIKGQTRIRVGGMMMVQNNSEPLIVSDGIICTNKRVVSIDPKTIQSVKVLKGEAATALYGSQGVNGVVLIETKKLPLKTLVADTVKKISASLSGKKDLNTIKIYPNPVQRGSSFQFTLSQKGSTYNQIQITHSSGVVVLNKRLQGFIPSDAYLPFKEQIQTAQSWSSGVYQLSVMDESNKIVARCSFLVL